MKNVISLISLEIQNLEILTSEHNSTRKLERNKSAEELEYLEKETSHKNIEVLGTSLASLCGVVLCLNG